MNDFDAEAVEWIRDSAKELGFNCTFVDDDLRIIHSLAERAVKAGLTDHLSENMQNQIRKKQVDSASAKPDEMNPSEVSS